MGQQVLREHIRNAAALLLSGLRDREHHTRARLVREELRGCLHGPRAWFQARRLRHAGS